jgi:hypothetical protein
LGDLETRWRKGEKQGFLGLALAAWHSGIVVIASAYRTEAPGFESRQGVRFKGIYMYIAVLLL